ncbi:MAG: enoyl-CoA hydratase-related protein [Gammaproteobacteria bacterium]
MSEVVLQETDARGVVTLTLNRPEKHNAFDAALIAELTRKLQQLNADAKTRILILTGAGKSFSAGADLYWMRSMAKFSEAENIEDALKLAELLDVLNALRVPTIARVNGAVFGGGVGLVACCDITVAAEHAKFELSEVKLGLVPSVISPYVIAAIGAHQARRYFLTAEAIPAARAREIGLVHEVVAAEALNAAVAQQVELLLKAGPESLAACKELIAANTAATVSARRALKQKTAQLIAQLRVSAEGQEGLTAFLEKRAPAWIRGRG